MLSGDFAQQQPLATVQKRTQQVKNTLSCVHCKSHTRMFTMSSQYRVTDKELLQFLHHIRYDAPTEEMIATICDGRILSSTPEINDTIYHTLELPPDALVLAITRKAFAFINEIIIKFLFPNPPLALIVIENEQLVSLHIGMKLIITQNINKKIGFVNGQIVNVSAITGNTIVAKHPSDTIINIFPVTRVVNDIPTTTYPCMPGYSTTISKIQEQTLQKFIIWLDTPTTHPGMAYVALSRVQQLENLLFMTPLTVSHFTTAELYQ